MFATIVLLLFTCVSVVGLIISSEKNKCSSIWFFLTALCSFGISIWFKSDDSGIWQMISFATGMMYLIEFIDKFEQEEARIKDS